MKMAMLASTPCESALRALHSTNTQSRCLLAHCSTTLRRYEAKLPPSQKINEQSPQGTLEQFIRDKYDGKRWFDASAAPGAAPAAAPAQHFPTAAAPRPQPQPQPQPQPTSVAPQAPQSNFFDFGDTAPAPAPAAARAAAPVAKSGGLLDDLLGTSTPAASGFDAHVDTKPKASTADIMGMYKSPGMGGMQMGGMQGQQGFGGQGMGGMQMSGMMPQMQGMQGGMGMVR
jgi:hypothetical protein